MFIRLIELTINMVAVVVWPITLLIIFWKFRQQLINILKSISHRMADSRTDVSIGKDGLEIRSRLEIVEIDQEQTRTLTLQALGIDGSHKTETTDIISEELFSIADQYLNINEPDYTTRLRLKDEAAIIMASIVVTNNIARPRLAEQSHDGLSLALAATSHAVPQSEDLNLLLNAGRNVTRLHVKYRIVMATERLFTRGLADISAKGSVENLFQSFANEGDQPLINRINYARKAITRHSNEEN